MPVAPAERDGIAIVITYSVVIPQNGRTAAQIQTALGAANAHGPLAIIDALKGYGTFDNSRVLSSDVEIEVEDVTVDLSFTPVI